MAALPNLSTWHLAPIGATIPAGMPYAYVYDDGATLKFDGHFEDIVVSNQSVYTERPVTILLPREEGATILATSDSDAAPCLVLTRKGNYWTTYYDSIWYDYHIAAWAPITIGNVVVK